MTPALCAASTPSASAYDRTTVTRPSTRSRSALTSRAQRFSSTATTSARESRSESTAAPPHASAGTTIASMSSRQRSPARGASPGATSEGARPRLTRTQGRKVWPSSSAHARGASSSSTSSGPSAGACAHGSRSSRVIRWEMIASAPPTASTPAPARYAASISSSSSSGKRATTAIAVQPAARSSSAPRSSVPGFCTLPHDAPAGDMLISTPTGASVVAYAPTSTPSVARHASAACRWRVRSSGSIAASSSSPTRWLVAGRKPQRPAANSSSAYPSV